MRTPSCKLLPKTLLALTAFFLYCLITLYIPPCFTPTGYLAAIIDKHTALESAQSPKVVFVGGSNLAMGLDSNLVSRALAMNTVNMGLCTLFGLPYCLEEVKDSIQSHDLVVIVPEYEYFLGAMSGTCHLLNVPLLYPRAWSWVWRSEGPRGVAHECCDLLCFKWHWWGTRALDAFCTGRTAVFGQALCRSVEYVFSADEKLPGISRLLNPGEHPYYDRRHFTKSGDYTGHLGFALPAFDTKPLPCVEPDSDAVDAVNTFAHFARGKGATVMLMPPPIPIWYYQQNQKVIESVYQVWLSELEVPVLGTPKRYAFSDDFFFDDKYHLEKHGRQIRTEQMVEDLMHATQVASR